MRKQRKNRRRSWWSKAELARSSRAFWRGAMRRAVPDAVLVGASMPMPEAASHEDVILLGYRQEARRELRRRALLGVRLVEVTA